jgi:SH3-like domain-containing protein
MILSQRLLATSISILALLVNNAALAERSNVPESSLVNTLPPENQCLTKAYAIDSTRNGLNVRQQPNLSGKIFGRLPKSTEVNVLGMQGKWILISVIDPVAQKVAFRNEGWVYSSLLGVSSMGYGEKSVNLYAQPSLRSKSVGKIPPNANTTILGCSGKWLRVETKNHQQRGWLEPTKQCAAALTTCS